MALPANYSSARVEADLVSSTTLVPSDTYTNSYVEMAGATERGYLPCSGKLAPPCVLTMQKP